MRTAEEIIKEIFPSVVYRFDGLMQTDVNANDIRNAMIIYAKEAIVECAKRVKVTDPYQNGRKIGLRDNNLENYIENNPAKVDKQSILSLIKELK